MNWWQSLRRWAARAIAPPTPLFEPTARFSQSGPEPAATTADRPEVGFSKNEMAAAWFPKREQSPAEKKRHQQQEEILELMLASGAPAGWISDHLEEANQCAGWVYVATDARAKRVGGAKLTVCRVNDDDPDHPEKLKANHPLCRLLKRPNPKYDLRGLLYRIEMQLCLTGTALIWSPKNGLGLPGRLWVLPTALARPQPPSPEYPDGSYQVSTISLTQWAFFGSSFWNVPSGVPMIVDAREIVRIQYPHPYTEADGLSPVWANGQAIDVNRSTEETLWSVFERGPMPGQLISIDKDMQLDDGAADELQSRVESRIGGSRNAGRVQVVQGAKVEKLTFSPTELIPDRKSVV